jgi:hypothetical protein
LFHVLKGRWPSAGVHKPNLAKKEKRPARPPLLDFIHPYFGAGVVVLPEFFLDFLPPLWAFLPDLVEVVFLPPSAGLSVDPPVAWANDRVAPSSSVNAIVSSFFIQSPSEKINFWESFNWGIIDVQHSKQRRWKKESGHLQGRFLETFSRKLFRRRSGASAGLFGLFPAFVMMRLGTLLARFGLAGGGGFVASRRCLSARAAACLSKAQGAAEYQSARDCE